MKTMLSMPRTISSAVRVSSAIQISGSVSSSMSAESLADGRHAPTEPWDRGGHRVRNAAPLGHAVASIEPCHRRRSQAGDRWAARGPMGRPATMSPRCPIASRSSSSSAPASSATTRPSSGPFGLRRVTYADYTASGRSLTFIEDYIREQVMPLYANTHSESSGTGRQTSRFREDARDIIREAMDAPRDEYAVIFCGSGSTAAVDKLIGILNLRIPADLDERFGLRRHIPPRGAPRRLHRPLRAPLQRAALARVDRRRRDHPRGPRRPHRPRAPG